MRRRRFPLALTVAALVALSGCASAPAYDPEVADTLQQQVLEVTTAAADGSFTEAQTALLELEADARDAHARGLITAERLESILAASVLVTATLEVEAAAAERRAEEERAAEAAAAAEADERAAAEEAAREAERGPGDTPPGQNRGGGRGRGEGD